MRLTGIIDRSMGNFFCLRGFAPMIDITNISESIENIQRDLISEHSGEMEKFLQSGEFTFFPEVILCADLQANKFEHDEVSLFREAINVRKNLDRKKLGSFKVSINNYNRKSQSNTQSHDYIATAYIDFDESQITKLLRIDGNHRLSAVNEASPDNVKSMIIPFCILFFNGAEETDKFCRALFHNINTKQVPLKSEENLKVIIEGNDVFTNDILENDNSFGLAYLYTRKILSDFHLADYPEVNRLIGSSKYTYFVTVIKQLLDDGLLNCDESDIPRMRSSITDINTALRAASIADTIENIAVLGAMTVYKLGRDEVKYRKFIQWINKNKIGLAKNLHINDVISIFNKIYRNSSKKIFMSMWFDEKTKDTYEMVKDAVSTIKQENHVDIEIIKVDEHTDGFSGDISQRIIKGINSCDLLIADLSYGNKNVHHEIGLAQGKGKKVIMLYHTRVGIEANSEIGSNISMQDQVRFRSLTDMRSQLTYKIRQVFKIE